MLLARIGVNGQRVRFVTNPNRWKLCGEFDGPWQKVNVELLKCTHRLFTLAEFAD